MKTNRYAAAAVCSAILLLAGAVSGSAGTNRVSFPGPGTDDRPPLEWQVHSIGNLAMAVLNNGLWGDPYGVYSSGEWPGGEGSGYLWIGNFWSCCYGAITPDQTEEKFASRSDYGNWELSASDGYPMEYFTPGPVAPEQTQYGMDDWDPTMNDDPYGMSVWVENYSWDTPGFDNFIAGEMLITHNSSMGNPGTPLGAFLCGIRGDCDVASADSLQCHIDDFVYYDGHAIWCNDPDATFEYQFDGGIDASTIDIYTWQQNPDNPLPSGDPENIWYHYNYLGADGIPDNDVDQNGVSDHFTILAKVTGGDTLYTQDPESGVVLFSEGMPYGHFEQTVGDTIYLVVPRNLSYMFDSDHPGSAEDDSGEPLVTPPCNGFIGWRLVDFWIEKADQSIERPIDVFGYPIPVSHTWWNWEGGPGSDSEIYDYMWGHNYDASGQYSGPAYLADWVGNPSAPEVILSQNPGPFPIVHDHPLALSYPQFDYRFLISLGPVEIEDGDTLHVVGGWVIGRGLDGLRMNADLLLDAYYRYSIWGGGTGVESPQPGITDNISIYPNPLGTYASIAFETGEPGRVRISVFDISGRLTGILLDTDLTEGSHTVSLDGSFLERGIYFLRVETTSGVNTERFVVLR